MDNLTLYSCNIYSLVRPKLETIRLKFSKQQKRMKSRVDRNLSMISRTDSTPLWSKRDRGRDLYITKAHDELYSNRIKESGFIRLIINCWHTSLLKKAHLVLYLRSNPWLLEPGQLTIFFSFHFDSQFSLMIGVTVSANHETWNTHFVNVIIWSADLQSKTISCWIHNWNCCFAFDLRSRT